MPLSPGDQIAVERLRRWRNDGELFQKELAPDCPLDPAQKEAMAYASGDGVKRLALQASGGTGKTSFLGLEVWRRWVCYGDGDRYPRGIAFSCNGEQLDIGLKAELRLWQERIPLLQDLFEMTDKAIRLRDRSDGRELLFRKWAKDADGFTQGKALSGLHGPFSCVFGDEVGTVSTILGDRAEQAMSDCRHGGIFIAGNPDSTGGLLHQKAVTEAGGWKVVRATGDPDDPNRSPRVDIEHARRLIASKALGREDPWIRVYVLGKYPLHGLNTLVSEDQVREAMERAPQATEYDWAATILGVDVARFGLDLSVIMPRQHLMVWQPEELAQVDGNQGAAAVARVYGERNGNAIFIDDGGGYGGAWIDQLRNMGFDPVGVKYQGPDQDPRMANKLTGMWWRMAEAVKDRLALPKGCQPLIRDLSTPQYSYVRDRMVIEDSESVKRRRGHSLDHGQALALTFAQDVAPPGLGQGTPGPASLWARQPQRSQGVDYGGEWMPGS